MHYMFRFVHTIIRQLYFPVALVPTRARSSSFLRFLYHTRRCTTVDRTPLDERSARRRYLYLTTYNTHNKQPCPPGRIRSHELSRWAASERGVRPRGHWDRPGAFTAKLYRRQYITQYAIINFKLPLCSECCLFSFGWFPGVCFIYADVSEHSICSIFKGRCEVILGCEGRLIYTGGILGPRQLGPIGNRRGRFRVQELWTHGLFVFCINCSLNSSLN